MVLNAADPRADTSDSGQQPSGAIKSLPHLEGVHVRVAKAHERPYPTHERALPLVIEATRARDVAFLKDFLRRNAARIVPTIHDHGAVLLRGFDINTDNDFEDIITSLTPMRPMRGYFMSEAGRDRSNGSAVFYTNINVRTGGDFSKLGSGLHTENFYSIDFPAFQCFWCIQPSWFGGETGLCHLERAFSDLGGALRARLERDCTCTVDVWSLDSIADRYGVSTSRVERIFEDFGIPAIVQDGHRYIALEKPIVVRHPYSGRNSLCANLSGELPSLCDLLEDHLLSNYYAHRWALHRLSWRHPRFHFLLESAAMIPRMLMHPGVARYHLENLILNRLRREVRQERRRQSQIRERARLVDKLDEADLRAMADALQRHVSVFTWQPNDVLVIDNLQVAHMGMPGLGPRELRAILCNALSFKYPLRGSPPPLNLSDANASIHERLREAGNAH